MNEKIDYLLSSLDLHITSGKSPQEVLIATIEDYMHIYHDKEEPKHSYRPKLICAGCGKVLAYGVYGAPVVCNEECFQKALANEGAA